MARSKTIASVDAEISKVKEDMSKAKARYEKLAEKLLSLQKEKDAYQAGKIMDALKKSGRSYQELMNFLNV